MLEADAGDLVLAATVEDAPRARHVRRRRGRPGQRFLHREAHLHAPPVLTNSPIIAQSRTARIVRLHIACDQQGAAYNRACMHAAHCRPGLARQCRSPFEREARAARRRTETIWSSVRQPIVMASTPSSHQRSVSRRCSTPAASAAARSAAMSACTRLAAAAALRCAPCASRRTPLAAAGALAAAPRLAVLPAVLSDMLLALCCGASLGAPRRRLGGEAAESARLPSELCCDAVRRLPLASLSCSA